MAETCTPPPLTFLPQSDRLPLIREAFRLEWLTIGWMTVEAIVAIAAGLTAGSLVLLAFGLDSVIELASASVLMWRLFVELRHGQKFSERAERTAGRIGGALLFLLAAYVTAAAVWQLWNRTGEEFSWPGFLVALIAIPAMRYLARRKIAIAEKIGSRALRADAMEAVTCGWLSLWLSLVSPLNGLSVRGGSTASVLLRSFGSWSRKGVRLGLVTDAKPVVVDDYGCSGVVCSECAGT